LEERMSSWQKAWQERGQGVDENMDAVIERESTVGAGVDDSSGWQMRQQMEALLRPEPKHPSKRSWSGAIREGRGRLLVFLSIMMISKVGAMRRFCERRMRKY
jgi:hypothetical protein